MVHIVKKSNADETGFNFLYHDDVVFIQISKKNNLSLILLLENRHDLTARFYKSIKKKDYYMM